MTYTGHRWFQAGHTFENGVRCACGRYWLDIRNTERSDIGKPGIAHSGNLTENEYLTIETRRRKEETAERDAMGVAGHTAPAPETAFTPSSWEQPYPLSCVRFVALFTHPDDEDTDDMIPF